MTYDINRTGLIKEINRLKSKEGYLFAGSPLFLGLFGRDSLISSWQMLDTNPEIARDTLIALSKVQGRRTNSSNSEEPGKILHEYYPRGTPKAWFNKYKAKVGWIRIGVPEYLSVDSTPLFIIVLAKYYEATGDSATLRRLWPNAKRALDWIFRYGKHKKFIRYVPKKGKLMSQSWKDGIGDLLNGAKSPVAVVEVQGYSYKAFSSMLFLMREMRDTKMSSKVAREAGLLKRSFQKAFWMPDERYYAMAVDGTQAQVKSISSNPGQLLFTGIISEDRSKDVVRRLFMRDMMTPYGIRTHSSKDRHFDPAAYQLGSIWPHDNWMIAQGLKELGYKSEYAKVKTAMVGAAKELGAIPEYYGVSKENGLIPVKNMEQAPCDPQAWSLGALIDMMR